MSKRRTQPTIPEPYQTLASLQTSVAAMKELVEILAGQRGDHDDQAVTWGELPYSAGGLWIPIPYINGWADYSAPYSPCGFRKLASGLVIMRSLVQGGSAAGICILPPGYRPSVQMLFIAETSPNAACRLDVSADGTVSHTGGSSGWISLSNVSFLAEN